MPDAGENHIFIGLQNNESFISFNYTYTSINPIKRFLMMKLAIINDSNLAKLLLAVITNNRVLTHLEPTWGRK